MQVIGSLRSLRLRYKEEEEKFEFELDLKDETSICFELPKENAIRLANMIYDQSNQAS